jgi:hypothetical protein
MVGGLGAQNIFYSASGNPIELTDNADLEFAKNKVRSKAPTLFYTLTEPRPLPFTSSTNQKNPDG